MLRTKSLTCILILLKVFTFSTGNGQSLDESNTEDRTQPQILDTINSVNCTANNSMNSIANIQTLIENHIKSSADETQAVVQDLAFVKLRFFELKESLQDISKIEESLLIMKQEHLQLNNSLNEIKNLLKNIQQVTVKESSAVQQKVQDLQATLTIEEVSSCEEAYKEEGGIYRLNNPDLNLKPFNVYCQPDSDGGSPWTIIQRRVDNSTNFYRGWDEYKRGFGNISGNYWIGLEKIHALTRKHTHELWISLEDFEGEKRTAKYSAFAIGNEDSKYKLVILGDYKGDAGDALESHFRSKFSTFNADNDAGDGNCATMYHGAFWFDKCHDTHLNGEYIFGNTSEQGVGIIWNTFRGNHYSLKFSQMAIRPIS